MLLTALLPLAATAQHRPSAVKAYNHYYDKNYVKAKEMIDLCTADEKLSKKAQTWLYKGNICYFLANTEYTAKQKDPNYAIQYPDAPVEAYDAFMKSKEMNPNMEAMDMFTAQQALPQLYPLLLVRGVDQLIAKDYGAAKSTLGKGIASYEMGKPQYPMHGDLYYYYAYALEALGDSAAAIGAYRKAIDDSATNAYVYVRLMENYKKGNNRAMAEKVLEAGRRNLPGSTGLKIAETDFRFWTGDSAAAAKLLESLDADNLSETDELVNVANFHIQTRDYEKAAALLEKADRRQPGNFVVLYNLGVCHYSLSERQFAEYNDLVLSDKVKADEYRSLSDRSLRRAAQYFEQARVIRPGDLNLLNTLKSIYIKQQSPKAEEIEAEIQKTER